MTVKSMGKSITGKIKKCKLRQGPVPEPHDPGYQRSSPVASFTSSSVVKEIASHGGNVRQFCSPYVEQQLWAKFGRDIQGKAKSEA